MPHCIAADEAEHPAIRSSYPKPEQLCLPLLRLLDKIDKLNQLYETGFLLPLPIWQPQHQTLSIVIIIINNYY
jgi:hypothetical protein